jgi:hypothetical protein
MVIHTSFLSKIVKEKEFGLISSYISSIEKNHKFNDSLFEDVVKGYALIRAIKYYYLNNPVKDTETAIVVNSEDFTGFLTVFLALYFKDIERIYVYIPVEDTNRKVRSFLEHYAIDSVFIAKTRLDSTMLKYSINTSEYLNIIQISSKGDGFIDGLEKSSRLFTIGKNIPDIDYYNLGPLEVDNFLNVEIMNRENLEWVPF